MQGNMPRGETDGYKFEKNIKEKEWCDFWAVICCS